MTTKVAEKWRLSVYGASHPRYRSGNCKWWREYETRGQANRAKAPVHRRFPGTVGELSVFKLDPLFPIAWVCGGERGVDVFELWNDEEGE